MNLETETITQEVSGKKQENFNIDSVAKIFEINPELVKIGSQEKYLEYIETIFSKSKVKDIVWRNDITEENVLNTDAPTPSGEYRGRFFGTYDEVKNHGGSTKIMFPVLLDLKNPKYFNSSQKLEYYYTEDNEKIKKEGYDGIESKKYDTNQPYEYVAYYLGQIHILGSNDDLDQFKEYILQNKL